MSVVIHVALPEADAAKLAALGEACGRKKATLAALAVGHFVRMPVVRALQRIDDEEVRNYLLENPAALEFLSEGMRRRLDGNDWAELVIALKKRGKPDPDAGDGGAGAAGGSGQAGGGRAKPARRRRRAQSSPAPATSPGAGPLQAAGLIFG